MIYIESFLHKDWGWRFLWFKGPSTLQTHLETGWLILFFWWDHPHLTNVWRGFKALPFYKRFRVRLKWLILWFSRDLHTTNAETGIHSTNLSETGSNALKTGQYGVVYDFHRPSSLFRSTLNKRWERFGGSSSLQRLWSLETGPNICLWFSWDFHSTNALETGPNGFH